MDIADALPPVVDRSKILVNLSLIEQVCKQSKIGIYSIVQDPHPSISVKVPGIVGFTSMGHPEVRDVTQEFTIPYSSSIDHRSPLAIAKVQVNLREVIRIIMDQNFHQGIRDPLPWSLFLSAVLKGSLDDLSQQNLGFFEFGRKLRISHLLHGPFTASIQSTESGNP